MIMPCSIGNRVIANLIGLLPALAMGALQPLDEGELARVNAQDGLEVELASPAMSMQSLTLNVDSATAARAANLSINNLRLDPLAPATSLYGYSRIDVGAATTSSSGNMLINFHLDRARLGGAYFGLGNSGNAGMSISHSLDPTRSYGEWVLVSDLDFRLRTLGGLFNTTANTSTLYLALNNATLLYRQNWYYHANMAMNNLNFLWDMPNGSVGVDVNGIRVAGDTSFRINFDFMYKFNPDQDMTAITANDRPLVNFGWEGMLYDSEVRIRGGGIWDTALNAATGGTLPGNRSEGINFGLRWNYKLNPATNAINANDLRWQLGHVLGDHERLEFADWRNLEGATAAVPGRYGFDFPNITLDVIPTYNGVAPPGGALGVGGLCWGGAQTTGTACTSTGTLLNLVPGRIEGFNADVNRANAGTLAWLVRNGNLLAWSNQVKISADAVATETYNWGLIYTLANINGNVYLYPGGSESHHDPGAGAYSRNSGIMADVLFMTQSFGNWSDVDTTRWKNGTHFLIADTASGVNMGIGILGASFLLAADDMRFWLKNGSGYSGGMDFFAPRARAQLKGLFGGARLPRGLDLVRIANVDLNLEGLWNARLSATASGQDYLGYSVAMRFRCGSVTPFGCAGNAFADSTGSVTASGLGSYISIEEPGLAGVDLRFDNLSGDIAWSDGRLELKKRGEDVGNPRPQLTLSNTLLIGASAEARMNDAVAGSSLGGGGAAGMALTSNLRFGGNEMLSIAIPSGTVYGAITLMPKN